MKKKAIAAIPAYNEATRIGPVITKTKKYVDEVIVVDDHSRDNTFEVAKKAGATTIRLVTNMGAGFATRTACDIAVAHGADYIVTIDADGQHDPSEIPKIVKPLTQGKELVFGSRPRDKNMPAVKRLGNWGLSFCCRIIFGLKIRDSQTGYHSFTIPAYKKIRWESDRYGLVSEFVANAARHKLKYSEVTVKTIYNEKEAGMSKLDAVKAVLAMLKWRMLKW